MYVLPNDNILTEVNIPIYKNIFLELKIVI